MSFKPDEKQTSAQPQQQGRTQRTGKNATSSLLGASIAGAPIAANRGAERLTNISRQFEEMLEKNGTNGADIKIAALDTRQSHLVCNVITVLQTQGDETAAFNFILDSTDLKLSPRKSKGHGRHEDDIFIPRVAGDIYNESEQFWPMAEKALERRYKDLGAILDAGAAVINYELSIEDEDALYGLLTVAVNATNSILNPENKLNLADFPEIELTASMDFEQEQLSSLTGLPVRKDTSISLYNVTQESHDIATDNHEFLTRTNAYVSLMYIGEGAEQQSRYGRDVPNHRVFQPRINITSVNCEMQSTNVGVFLMGLMSATLWAPDHAWVNAISPKFFGKEGSSDLRSLKGLEVELKNIDPDITVDPSNKEFDFAGFVSTFIEPDPLFVLHAGECDENSWLYDMIRMAVQNGNSMANPAYAELYDTLDALSDNRFSQAFEVGQPIGHLDGDQVINGYFLSENGEQRIDLRTIDELAFYNMVGETDAALAQEYADTFNPNTASLDLRLSKRIECLQRALQGNVNVKGYSTPIILDPEFLSIAYDCISAVAGDILLDSHIETYRERSRGYSKARNYAFDSSGMSFGSRRGAVAGQSYRRNTRSSRWTG